tara:strand:- start:3280 stop:3621 length:342 start_codon:yes stop_codon:yes gene_type:complete
MKTRILTNRSDYLSAIDEQKQRWVYFILESLELDMDIAFGEDKGDAFDYLVMNNIEILDYPEISAVKIEFGGDLVGEWGCPEYNLKKDEECGELYYEIIIENWSIFDEQDEEY